jgi:hypothetical protein
MARAVIDVFGASLSSQDKANSSPASSVTNLATLLPILRRYTEIRSIPRYAVSLSREHPFEAFDVPGGWRVRPSWL